ncbi:septum site-determining protein MinC [Pseudanabaena sp. PCC 6802]|uniref:septum site-determining protein MinC n=1 Tax=Pseudanabaena sp. PCC 6802 TaxID=118173 RepID=UPI00037FECA4|nr:septum site-determining protein MinC [Pseudanabaena sp. PCC 6802]
MSVEESKPVETKSPPPLPKSLAEEGFLTVDIPDEIAADRPENAAAQKKPEASSPTTTLASTKILKVRLQAIDGKLMLLLPDEQIVKAEDGSEHNGITWSDVLEQLQQCLNGSDRFWSPGTLVYLQGGDRLLDAGQLHEIATALQTQQLVLHCVITLRRQTAIAAATMGLSVEQGRVANDLIQAASAIAEPLYVKMTVRSGTEIRHPGSAIVFGDVNAGGEVIADGDILVWGKLKGVAHAGANGNKQARILALHLEATQLRIGDLVARVEPPSTQYLPEVAYVNMSGTPSICIVSAADYFSSMRHSQS